VTQLDHDRFIELTAQWADIGFDAAERAVRATLETLAERIDRGEAQQVAEQLPPEIAPEVATDGPAQKFDVDEFLRRVAEREAVGIKEAERHVRAVFEVLRHVLEKEFNDVVAELPKEFAPLFGLPPVPEVVSADAFLKRVSERTGLDPDEAERAADAVLETLAERIAGGEVRDLISRLPARFHEPLKVGDELTGGKAIRMSLEEFVLRVADQEGVAYEEALDHVRAVLATLHEAVGDDEWTDLTVELPREYDAVLAG
jgi:uncharacterized protein (DUF2267 family)